MEDHKKKQLTQAGIHVDDGLSRFMENEGLFLKFLGNSFRIPIMKVLYRRWKKEMSRRLSGFPIP